MNTEFFLSQTFEESRYYRRFHHTVYTLFITVYIALLGLQISFPEHIGKIRDEAVLAFLFIFFIVIIVPGYVLWILMNYHKRVANLNSLIANIAANDEDFKKFVDKHDSELVGAFNEFVYDKYRDVASHKRCYMGVGSGHWFFIITFLIIDICNLAIFFIMK